MKDMRDPEEATFGGCIRNVQADKPKP